MGQGVTLGGSRKPVAKSMFRLEIDGILGDLRPTNAGALKITFSTMATEEGGRMTTADETITGYKYEPIKISRTLTDNTDFVEWVARQKQGTPDKRGGRIYALDTEGRDLYRWRLYDLQVMDFQDFDGDAKAKEEPMVEEITLKYRERDERELLQ